MNIQISHKRIPFVMDLRNKGITDTNTLRAMEIVPRDAFVPDVLKLYMGGSRRSRFRGLRWKRLRFYAMCSSGKRYNLFISKTHRAVLLPCGPS